MISEEKNWPPNEFCKANCPSEVYNEITRYKSNDGSMLLRQYGNEHGKRLYRHRVWLFRRAHGCNDCEVATQWEIDEAGKEFQNALEKMFDPKDIHNPELITLLSQLNIKLGTKFPNNNTTPY